jgi:hypothetical protein
MRSCRQPSAVVGGEAGGGGGGGEEGSQEAVVLIVLCKRGPVHRGRTGFPRLRYGLPCRKGRDVPGVALAVKLHFKARAGETGVGAEPLPQERGQPHEHRPVGPTRLFIHRGQLQKRFATGLNHLRRKRVALEGRAQRVAVNSEPAVAGENHGRESTPDRDKVGPGVSR